jgi:hypothetical protein
MHQLKKKKKNTSLVSSGWSSNYSKTKKTSVAYTCATASNSNKPKNSLAEYKPPNPGSGAGIIVDKDGNIVQNGAHACSADCFKTNSAGMKNWYTYINGQKVYPNRSGSPYRFVMFEGASPSGNIASKCGGGNCKYNFADDTYTDLRNGQVYKAGE